MFKDSLSCLSDFGRLIVYGFITRDPIQINPEPLLPGNKTIRGFYLEPYIEQNKPLISSALNELADYVAAGDLQVSIGGSFSLKDAPVSHRLLEKRKANGKLVILPWE